MPGGRVTLMEPGDTPIFGGRTANTIPEAFGGTVTYEGLEPLYPDL